LTLSIWWLLAVAVVGARTVLVVVVLAGIDLQWSGNLVVAVLVQNLCLL
jgi:hypothetical protein